MPRVPVNASRAMLERARRQQAWIEAHGRDRQGYIEKYGPMGGTAIYEADLNALLDYKRMAGLGPDAPLPGETTTVAGPDVASWLDRRYRLNRPFVVALTGAHRRLLMDRCGTDDDGDALIDALEDFWLVTPTGGAPQER